MKTVRDLYELNPTKGMFGVEIEVEGRNLPTMGHYDNPKFYNYWRITEDASLRGEAWEYVLREPLMMEEVIDALKVLERAYEDCESYISNSIRAGIHIHLNVQELSLRELANFLTLYYLFEGLLIEHCGEDRAGNLFCLRSKDAYYSMQCIVEAFSSGRFGKLSLDYIRYTSLNLCSLHKYGSVEFRALRSTRDFEKVIFFCHLFANMLSACKIYKSPSEILESISAEGYESILTKVFGKVTMLALTKTPNWHSHIAEGISFSQELAFSYKEKAMETASLRVPHNNLRVGIYEKIQSYDFNGIPEYNILD